MEPISVRVGLYCTHSMHAMRKKISHDKPLTRPPSAIAHAITTAALTATPTATLTATTTIAAARWTRRSAAPPG
eukprot:scaffold74842_cov58-Phaeocystis_antarctica.AAC.1